LVSPFGNRPIDRAALYDILGSREACKIDPAHLESGKSPAGMICPYAIITKHSGSKFAATPAPPVRESSPVCRTGIPASSAASFTGENESPATPSRTVRLRNHRTTV